MWASLLWLRWKERCEVACVGLLGFKANVFEKACEGLVDCFLVGVDVLAATYRRRANDRAALNVMRTIF
jgi:hypothetical protein